MVKVQVRCGNVSVEADNQKELFETLASYQEVFSIQKCASCKKENLIFRVRETPDVKGKMHKYFEISCQSCYAKLPFGQHGSGDTLFPKQWVRWDRDKNEEVEIKIK